jgi:hypothetical protein
MLEEAGDEMMEDDNLFPVFETDKNSPGYKDLVENVLSGKREETEEVWLLHSLTKEIEKIP